IPNAVHFVIYLVQTFLTGDQRSAGQIGGVLLWQLPTLSGFALGVYLLLGGEKLIDRCLREVSHLCPACGYDLPGLKGSVCRECGATIPQAPTGGAPAGGGANAPERPAS